jgi:hypothetical protein
MLGFSPAQRRVAADCTLSGSISAPACRPADNNTGESITQVLQQRITSKQQQLYNEEWSTKLPFSGICPASVGCADFDDILDFCRKDHMFQGWVFRFSSDLYPPTSQGLATLKQELVATAKLRGGVDLVSRGCANASKFTNLTTEPQICYRLVCNCKLIFQNESKKLNKENGKVDQSIKYRKSTLHNDRLNDRTTKDDEKLAHKTSTCRRKTKDDPMCPFTLPLFVDKDGFVLKIGVGNPNHQYHARAEVNKVSRVQTAILSEQQREELRDVEHAHIGKSSARNMFFTRHGILQSRFGTLQETFTRTPNLVTLTKFLNDSSKKKMHAAASCSKKSSSSLQLWQLQCIPKIGCQGQDLSVKCTVMTPATKKFQRLLPK